MPPDVLRSGGGGDGPYSDVLWVAVRSVCGAMYCLGLSCRAVGRGDVCCRGVCQRAVCCVAVCCGAVFVAVPCVAVPCAAVPSVDMLCEAVSYLPTLCADLPEVGLCLMC